MRWCGSCFGMPQLLKCKITEILHWFKEKILPVRYNKKEDDNRHPLLMSGYCDSNTGHFLSNHHLGQRTLSCFRSWNGSDILTFS